MAEFVLDPMQDVADKHKAMGFNQIYNGHRKNSPYDPLPEVGHEVVPPA